MSKKLISAVAAATLGATALSTPAQAEITATAGLVSEYVFRGLSAGGAAANGSIDFDAGNGFTAGVWAIDGAANPGYDDTAPNPASEDSGEFDVYAAYSMDMDSWNWSLGVTTYQYTDSTLSANEANIGLGIGDFSLALDMGNVEDSEDSAVDVDIAHYALAWAVNDVYTLTVGQTDPNTDDDAGGEDDEVVYLDVTAAGEVSGVDAALSLGFADEAGDDTSADGYLTLSVSKTFDSLGF